MTELTDLNVMDNIIASLKNKYTENGIDSLTEKEKLMILLSFSENKNNIEAAAENILGVYGTVNAAAEADMMLLANQCHISSRSALLINLVSYTSQRDEIMKIRKKTLDSVRKAKVYFSAYLKNTIREQVVLTAVNNKFSIVKTHFVGYGEFDKAYIQVRDIIEFAIKNNSRYIFMAHSHPTTSSRPSDSDVFTTKNIVDRLKNADIKLVDHIIVSRQNSTSMRELKSDIFEPIEKYKTSKNKPKKSAGKKAAADNKEKK